MAVQDIKNGLKTDGWFYLPAVLMVYLFVSGGADRHQYLNAWFGAGVAGPAGKFLAFSWAVMVSYVVSIAGMMFFLRLFGLSEGEIGWKKPVRPLAEVGVGAATGLAGLLLKMAVVMNIVSRLMDGVWLNKIFRVTGKIGTDLADPFTIIRHLNAWTIGPVIEELAFRGIIYVALEKKWGKTPAVIGSSILFSLMHINLSDVILKAPHSNFLILFIQFLVPGLIFGWLRARTGSLTAPIAAHSMSNFALSLMAIATRR